MCPSSACQPKSARVNAAVISGSGEAALWVGFDESFVEICASWGVFDDVEHTRGSMHAYMSGRSNPSGIEGSVGSSEAIASRDW